ncbi:MarR family winged helix-turn-helix transcriptional regulator [Actinoplanes sp. M2I2]|uniref:MarR family winged helix-turn-helix transcriptional regulator n=1 Tax=Actinoplanes sp. M2I2 TaxID=1734444 RepID=UPI002021F47E|nr:MarR family winged helix-turn-helix transcriptional regulator [Actinoplanes sp. M2I2]
MNTTAATIKEPMTDGPWLDADQRRVWLAWIRLQLRMTYEINRQLQADSALSMADYDVLTGLSVSPGNRLPISALANQLGWERSRVSHHVKRMAARGLVAMTAAEADRRVTEVTLTEDGGSLLRSAAPGHAALVKNLFFGDLPPAGLPALAESLEQIYANVLANGTLPPPPDGR